jgi:F420-non-reducing hydrogenase iron-sulfur subunit
MAEAEFEPRIIAFLCNWCAYTGADLTGTSHYQSGNYKARRRVAILQSILQQMGFDQERVWLRWISASEGQYFADTVTQMVDALKQKGPNPLHGVGAI